MNKGGFLKGDTDLMYRFVRAYARVLGLDNLENGFDSTEIRIWLGHSLARFNQVVIISNVERNWYGQVVTYTGNQLKTL